MYSAATVWPAHIVEPPVSAHRQSRRFGFRLARHPPEIADARNGTSNFPQWRQCKELIEGIYKNTRQPRKTWLFYVLTYTSQR